MNSSMIELCHLNSSKCLNNGLCVVNISLNSTYCQCDSCYTGIFCENKVRSQKQYDTNYVELIMSIIELCFTVLNNSPSLELFIRCRRIRHTNCGIYLLVYSILSILSSILLVVDRAMSYSYQEKTKTVYCYVGTIGYNMLICCT